MPRTALQLAVSACSHTGKVRAANQDAYGYSTEAQCFVLCDGMGGAAGGEIASRLTVEAFLERLVPDAPGTIPRRIEQAVAAANRLLRARAQREPALDGMGTTLVALVLGDAGRAWIAHVGDSRCYLLRGETLVRCTRDHSLIEEQVRLGQLTQAQAAVSPMRNVITRAVGVYKTISVECIEITVQPGDVFLLCSDGLTREVPERRIASLLLGLRPEPGTESEPSPDLALALVEEALATEAADNVTCLTVRVA